MTPVAAIACQGFARTSRSSACAFFETSFSTGDKLDAAGESALDSLQRLGVRADAAQVAGQFFECGSLHAGSQVVSQERISARTARR